MATYVFLNLLLVCMDILFVHHPNQISFILNCFLLLHYTLCLDCTILDFVIT